MVIVCLNHSVSFFLFFLHFFYLLFLLAIGTTSILSEHSVFLDDPGSVASEEEFVPKKKRLRGRGSRPANFAGSDEDEPEVDEVPVEQPYSSGDEFVAGSDAEETESDESDSEGYSSGGGSQCMKCHVNSISHQPNSPISLSFRF